MPGYQRPRQDRGEAESHFRNHRQNDGFVVSEEYTAAADGGTATLHLKNPAGNDETILFQDILVGTTRASTARIYDDFSTAPSGGSTAVIQNMLLDSANGSIDSGEMEANRGVSFTADSTQVVSLIGGGETKKSIGATGQPPLFAMEPGREIVVETTNNEVEQEQVAMTITYSEVDTVFSEQ